MADAPKSHGRHFGFHGREKEFAWLRGMFDAVATKGADGKFIGPRMAVIVAESGIGKSRLVQELYIRLTNDPQWDPPEVDYWPEAFGDGGVNLRAVPDMKGHVPKGPPRFAWLGARWQSPEERNALARRSVLPEVRSSVMVHAEILKSHGSAWADAASRVSESVRKEGVGESIGAAADLVGIPFFGLMSKLAKGAKDLVADRMAGPKSFEKVEQEEIKSEVDEVLDCMQLLLNGSGAVPSVLWLDDAQWIDDESLVFLHRLWKEAERRKWPLLVVATHWEREWRELAVAERTGDAGDTLHDFAGSDGVEVAVLENAARGALRACVVERLPGLTDAQQSLLVEKAGGNFLTMAENIGELLAEPMWFEGERVDGSLVDAAVEHIRGFETERERRVQQRFKALETEVKKLLGWSVEIGSRFLRDVVIDFAAERALAPKPQQLLQRCFDPYSLLARPNEAVCEFRDPAYARAAGAYFSRFLEADRPGLEACARRRLLASLSQDIFKSDLPVRHAWGSRTRVYAGEAASQLVSLRVDFSCETWATQPVEVLLSEAHRDEFELAARYLRVAGENLNRDELRVAMAVRLWLMSERSGGRATSSSIGLEAISGADWCAELYSDVPPKLFWIWAGAIRRFDSMSAQRMYSAALSKWGNLWCAMLARGFDSEQASKCFDEFWECSRMEFDFPSSCRGSSPRVQLAKLVLRLAESIPAGYATPRILQSVSHSALVLAISQIDGEGQADSPMLRQLGPKIHLAPDTEDRLYLARRAVWLRLEAAVADRTDVEALAERLIRAIEAHRRVPESERDPNDSMALMGILDECVGLFEPSVGLRLRYQIAEFQFETSGAIEKACRAIEIARLHEHDGDLSFAIEWWERAFADWAESAADRGVWHSNDCIGFQFSTRTCCARLLADQSLMQRQSVRTACLHAAECILKDALSEAPSDWWRILDYQLLSRAVQAIGDSVSANEPALQRAQLDQVVRRLFELCAQAEERQRQEGCVPW
jgi:hypothetical protein